MPIELREFIRVLYGDIECICTIHSGVIYINLTKLITTGSSVQRNRLLHWFDSDRGNLIVSEFREVCKLEPYYNILDLPNEYKGRFVYEPLAIRVLMDLRRELGEILERVVCESVCGVETRIVKQTMNLYTHSLPELSADLDASIKQELILSAAAGEVSSCTYAVICENANKCRVFCWNLKEKIYHIVESEVMHYRYANCAKIFEVSLPSDIMFYSSFRERHPIYSFGCTEIICSDLREYKISIGEVTLACSSESEFIYCLLDHCKYLKRKYISI